MIRETLRINHDIPHGLRHDASDYEWVGKSRFALLSDYTLNRRVSEGEIVRIGPYVLRVIELNHYWTEHLVCRAGGWRGVLTYALFRGTRTLDRIYRRVVITMAVWGLARYRQQGHAPSWRDVHLLRRIAEIMHV